MSQNRIRESIDAVTAYFAENMNLQDVIKSE